MMENIRFERAYQLYQVKRYKDAIKYLKDSIQTDPNDYDSKSLLIKCYLEIEDYDLAKQHNELLIKENPNDPDLFYNRALISRIKDDDESFNAINEAIRLEPYEPAYFGFKGLLYLEKKEYQKGLGSANEGLSLNPNHVLCLNVRAQVLTKLDKKQEAQITIENTLRQDPEGSFSHANVGWVQLEQGNHKKAMEHFKEALKNDPNSRFAKDGMIEAIKAKNFVYRLYLKYAFWISNMKSKNQWFFIIGIYLLYRFLVKSVQLSNYPFLAVFIIIPYMLFALGAWIIQPMSNAILLFHSYGKYLLDKEGKQSGVLFFACLVLCFMSFMSYLMFDLDVLLLVSVSSLCAIIPLSYGAIKVNKISRLISIGIGVVILCFGIIGPFFKEDITFLGVASILGLVAYTWLGNFLKD